MFHFCDVVVIAQSKLACEQALREMEGERKEVPVCTPQSLPFHPFFDISVIYAKYLAHISGSATEIIIKITLVDGFVSFDILNCKNFSSVDQTKI